MPEPPRLNATRYRVLDILVATFDDRPGAWLNATEIAQRADDLLPPTSYPALEWLIRLGLLEWVWETGDGAGRRLYRLVPQAQGAARDALRGFEQSGQRATVHHRPETA